MQWPDSCFLSHHPGICKTEIPILTYNDVINYFNIKIFGSFPDLMRQVFIRLAGFETAGGMIMAKDEIDRIHFQGLFQDDPGIGHRSRYPALADHFKMIYPVGLVQE